MNDSEKSDLCWLKIVAEAWEAADGRLDDVRSELTRRLGGTQLAAAVLSGVGELLRYADQEWEADETAIEAEEAALAASRRAFRPLLEAKLQRRATALDDASGPCTCTSCNSRVRSQGRRGRAWTSMLGPLFLRRRYARCATCVRGVAPAQDALGLSWSDFTPRFEEVCTLMSVTVPFGMARDLVTEVCGVAVSVKGVQEMTERRGAAVLELDKERAEECAPFDPKGLPVAVPIRPLDTVPEAAAPKVAYLDIDGVVPITREEFGEEELTAADRDRIARAKAEKARGGKGKRFHIVGREVKNAVLYDGKDCVSQSVGRGCLLDKTYVSHLGSWTEFAQRLWVSMRLLRFDQAELLVVLSDGAEWIRSLSDWLPVPTFLILDLFHVKHRIWEVARSLHGAHAKKTTRWANLQCERVEDGEAKKVIATLRRLSPARAEARELVRLLISYLENNLDRMNYPEYRARGLRVGSGAVESANFHVTGARLKLQGMRWSEEGARQMAALRADLFNGRHRSRSRQLLAA